MNGQKDRTEGVAPPSPAAGPAGICKRTRGYLPHWEREGGIYFVTFRLADSLPSTVISEIQEHKRILGNAKQSRSLLPAESVSDHHFSERKIEAYLDTGSGECVLRNSRIAGIVADALRFGDGKRYSLFAWCVMPNHVHVLVQPFSGHGLATILASWKSFTARRVNSVLRRKGTLWQREYFDRLIRDDNELKRAIEYIRDNPIKAGLRDWRWVYVKEEARGPAAEDGGATSREQP